MKALTSASKPTPANLLQMSINLRDKFKTSASIDICTWAFDHSGTSKIHYKIWLDSHKFYQSDIESFSKLFDIYYDLMSKDEESDPIAEKESLLDQHYDDKFHAMKDEGEL